MPAGRLARGAGTHLASWLQEVDALSGEEAQAILDGCGSEGGGGPPGSALAAALEGITRVHGARGGHARAITGAAISGDLLATKDPQSMRLWRSRGDFALLRVVTSRGAHVAFHPGGQFIVTGQRRPRSGPESDGHADATDPGELRAHVRVRVRVLPPKVWGPAGGSAYTAGKPGLQPKPRAALPRGGGRPRDQAVSCEDRLA